jgi:short-subunit dehydrogenase
MASKGVNLRDAVVVVTGASSGIGRATAVELADRGARVVVTARREEPLRELVEECRALGAEARAVPADVTDQAAMEKVARVAAEAFGGLDAWVNNAGVLLVARFEDSPDEAYRQVMETNFFGYVHGARAALPEVGQRGRGVLVNVSSIHGVGGAPYASAYAASKFAVRGWAESLRQELRGDAISVCTVLPAAIDTPLFQHAGNHMGRALKPPNPTYDPELVARTIVGCIERPKREVFAGGAGRAVAALHALAPALYERVMARMIELDEFQDVPEHPSNGNILHPMPLGTDASGGWKEDGPARPQVARGGLAKKSATAAAIAAPAAAGLAWYWRSRRAA